LVVAGDVSGDVTMSNAGVVSLAAGSVDLAHMSSNSVDEDNLQISNTGTNGQVLTKQSGNTGGLTWASVTSSIFSTAVTLIIYNSAGVAQKTIVGSST
jgi:hypothetical protein